MKKIFYALTLVILGNSACVAQELMITNIQPEKFSGVYAGGDMGQILYVPYFSNDSGKQNFVVKNVNAMAMNDEPEMKMELPDSYELKNAAFNGSKYLFFFADKKKQEEVLLIACNGNIVSKKSIKNTGNTYIPYTGIDPDHFILLTVTKKGDYSVESIDTAFATQWKKNFSAGSGKRWDVLSVHMTMEALSLLVKENSENGKYQFQLHKIQKDNGAEIARSAIKTDSASFYPTFVHEKEGMTFTGGYSYKNGVVSSKPDGIFFATLSPEGRLDQVCTAPYSRLIEDVKNTLGDKLANSSATVLFNSGFLAHESQSFLMVGQVLTREVADGVTRITGGDFVTVRFSTELSFTNATVVKNINQKTLVLKGTDATPYSTLDLGTWLNNAGLLQFNHFAFLPAYNPVMAYESADHNGFVSMCFQNVGLEKDTTDRLCEFVSREPSAQNNVLFNGITQPVYPALKVKFMMAPQQFDQLLTYEQHKNTLLLRKVARPDLKSISLPAVAPIHVPENTDPPQVNQN